MRATQTEAVYYPVQNLQLDDIKSVLCVAPHPDDEILGCGGLLSRLAASQCRIHVLILSGGENATGVESRDLAESRVQESLRAARVLGLPEPVFLQLPDRGMQYAEPLIGVLENALEQHQPQYLLLPSLSEPHPDHQAVALAGLAAAQRSRFPQTVLFYEVGAPLHPNSMLDITDVASLKWQALDEFTSQEAIQPYKVHSQAMAVLRAFGRGSQWTHAEAFFQVDAASLRASGASVAMPFWPAIRSRQHLANSPQQLPLVSVLIRSMDRFQLSEAIACVAMQTYPHIELVVVNATGRTHSPVQYPRHRMAWQFIEPAEVGLQTSSGQLPSNPGVNPRCGRSHAANLALQAARGAMAIFLDDDDLIDPGHIERLVDALARSPRAMAAYAGVRVDGEAGLGLRIYDLPWSPHRLRGINFLPIHAVVFRLDRASQLALRFDESLPVLEDWDFWRRLAEAGEFVHCPGVSAVYRQHHGDSMLGDPAHENHWMRWHLLLTERYLQSRPVAENAKTMAWHAVELDRQQAFIERALAEKNAQQQTVAELTAAMNGLKDDIARLKEEHIAIVHHHCDELKERNSTLEALEEKNHELMANLGNLLARHEKAAAQHDALSESHQKINDAFLQAQSACSRLLDENALLQAEIVLVQRSRSWKFTHPLRAFNRWLGKSSS
ncbi:MAG: hypothetical protein JWP79_3106 [Polaromonas sp.]|nr:hypothetical protein [Polaromonas sp.]MDB5938790.1 hypothetical protein [Polaromonas sp.]